MNLRLAPMRRSKTERLAPPIWLVVGRWAPEPPQLMTSAVESQKNLGAGNSPASLSISAP
jgi:hypothetical protein